MFRNELMDICLTCDHCRVKFGTKGLDLDDPEKALDTPTMAPFSRKRVARIWCERGMLTDYRGLPRSWSSFRILESAVGKPGTCPMYRNGDEEDGE